ncbi:hypothetical protein C3747_291g8 [Trypanosoma cruzi]|uniref:Target of rapamycin (TOR) kinase 1 n=1 Tax=Trypanosoma cruzi TaxID=5693 RepID=A0A2V2VDS0_TRYCR|nr:hypothetical protein C3747_291g8 [Trypanosoma cruzi]
MRPPLCARVYVTTTFSSRQCYGDCPHITGVLCRRHPRPTFRRQRLVRVRDCDTSMRIIVGEPSIPQKRHRPPSSRTHCFVDEEPFSFQTPATLTLPDESGRGSLFLSCRPRRARYAWPYQLFIAILPSTMDVWADNTSLQGAASKGSSKSHAMTWELRRIYEFLDSHGVQESFAYLRPADNPADGISRGRVFALQDLAKGWNL